MPRIGMEAQRRASLVRAAVEEIAATGTPDVTVAKIAKRAGMSPALAHHYFGSKTGMLVAAMRHVLRVYGAEARERLAKARTPRARLDAIVTASFAPSNFDEATVAAWLNFYVQARSEPGTRRLLHVYQARLRSNLRHALRPLTDRPETMAEAIGALIDGLYVRQALGARVDAAAIVTDHIDRGLR